MKATKLIRDKGFKYAKEIADSAPDNATEWNEGYEFQCGQSVEISPADREKYFVDLVELKRLVESLDRIAQLGGLSKVKDHLDYLISFGSEFAGVSKQEIGELQQAIRDHESVYLLKCSHGYDVACLICGFGTINGERVYHNKGKSK
ncbi:TPA: hypothetical protein ACIFCM_002440 [Acinetobacter baumannii]